MAIIDQDPEPISLTVTYSILSFIFFFTACFTFQTTNFSRHASDCAHSYMLRYGFCLPSVIYCILLATLAVSTRLVLNLFSAWTYIIYCIQPIAVPILLNVLFEICYLVHKSRSVNFAGLEFDQGHRVRILNSRTRSFILRNTIRIVSLVMLVLGIVANFNIIFLDQTAREEFLAGNTEESELVGRIGWWGLHPWNGQVHLLLSLIPAMVLVVVGFYLSIVLWTYGTNSSIVVHSSYINPWCSQFFGTLCMAVGQCFGENLYLITSHLGYLILIWSDLYLMRKEISKEILQTKDFEDFLQKVADIGNEITIRNVLMPGSVAVDPPVIPSTTIISDDNDDVLDDDDDNNNSVNNLNDNDNKIDGATKRGNTKRTVQNQSSDNAEEEGDLNATVHARGGRQEPASSDATIEYNTNITKKDQGGDIIIVPGEEDGISDTLENDLEENKKVLNGGGGKYTSSPSMNNSGNRSQNIHRNTQSIDGFDVTGKSPV